jgi:hypothetical protein
MTHWPLLNHRRFWDRIQNNSRAFTPFIDDAELIIRMGIKQPVQKVAMVFVRLWLRRFPFLCHAGIPEDDIAVVQASAQKIDLLVKVREQVHNKSVLSIKLVSVGVLHSFLCFLWVLVLKENVSKKGKIKQGTLQQGWKVSPTLLFFQNHLLDSALFEFCQTC